MWGWIKRWFDPVTVSKIFIISKSEVKPTLSRFMDPKDFPRKYGGELDWNWGDMPHLDAETSAALEKDGNKGWVPGPCLWLNGQRVPVGSVNGKMRRPKPEIEQLKPVIYAADYTETPVHPDKKGSVVSTVPFSQNGTASVHHHAEEAAVAGAIGGVTSANLIAAKTNSNQEVQGAHTPAQSTEPVHSQAAQTNVVAEPVQSQPPQVIPEPQPQSYALALPKTGPVPEHTDAMTRDISDQQAGEPVAIMPPNANGHMSVHDEVTMASDPSKELAIETEKLNHVDKKIDNERPTIERFVTAVEM